MSGPAWASCHTPSRGKWSAAHLGDGTSVTRAFFLFAKVARVQPPHHKCGVRVLHLTANNLQWAQQKRDCEAATPRPSAAMRPADAAAGATATYPAATAYLLPHGLVKDDLAFL